MKPLRIPPWLWVVILIGWLITVLFVLAIPEPAGSQGVYPPPAYPTYLPPPPTIYRPTPTTTPGPVCCYVMLPLVTSANITFGIEPGRVTP